MSAKRLKKNKKLHSFTVLHEEGFAYLADNSYIHGGYRLHYSFRDCFYSLFELHNETLNVWTHMVGSLIFVSLLIYLIAYNHFSVSRGFATQPNRWCGSEHMFVNNGLHTRKMFLSVTLPSECPLHFELSIPKEKKKYYEVAGIIFEHSIQQIPSLKRFHDLLEDQVGDISSGLASQIEVIRTELVILHDRLSNVSTYPATLQISQLKEQLHHRVEEFSSYLHGVASDVGADISMKYAIEELHGLAESVRNGIKVMSSADSHHVPHWPIFVFIVSAVICLTCSATFHLLFVYSKPVYFFLSRLDYAGITIMIAGSFYPLIYYSFYCHPWVLRVYLTTISSMAAITFAITLVPAFGTSKYLMLRTGVFLSLGLFGVVPMIHLIWQFGIFDPHVTVMIGPLLIMAALYIAGAVIYATRFPERFYPGRFDVWFSSHQLWHICVVAAALVHFVNALQHYEWRWQTTCNV
jgi:adiponectin receptor